MASHKGMSLSVRILLVDRDGRRDRTLRAVASILVNGCIGLKYFRVVEEDGGKFAVYPPSHIRNDGCRRAFTFFTTREAREWFQNAVLREYCEQLRKRAEANRSVEVLNEYL